MHRYVLIRCSAEKERSEEALVADITKRSLSNTHTLDKAICCVLGSF